MRKTPMHVLIVLTFELMLSSFNNILQVQTVCWKNMFSRASNSKVVQLSKMVLNSMNNAVF